MAMVIVVERHPAQAPGDLEFSTEYHGPFLSGAEAVKFIEETDKVHYHCEVVWLKIPTVDKPYGNYTGSE